MDSTRAVNSNRDRAGIVIASLCFVHCVAGPLILTFAGFTSLLHLSEKFESVFLLASAAMGMVALVPPYLRKHRRRTCLAMFGCGIFCLFAKRHLEQLWVPAEPIVAGIGALLLISAHVLNLKFSKSCPCCEPTGNAKYHFGFRRKNFNDDPDLM
jgi:hypothetical protein